MAKKQSGSKRAAQGLPAKAGKRKHYLDWNNPARTHDRPNVERHHEISERMAAWRRKHFKAVDGSEDHLAVTKTADRTEQPQHRPARKNRASTHEE